MAVLPAGMRGSDKDTPLLSVLGQLLNGPLGVMEGLELPLYSSTLLESPSLPLPLWGPVKGCPGDVAWLSSHHMSDPSPSPSYDNGAHAVLVDAGEKMFVGDGLRQGYPRDSSKVPGVEGGQFV